MNNKITFGGLFSGIGGIDLGFERAGMICKWQVENNEFCNKVLNKHWPDVPKYGDIKNVGKENLETVDLIAGGFPCQPFSVAGKRRGTEDDRHLWPEMLRVISELRPTWVVAENVPGIINVFLHQAIFDLAREGYKALPIVLPANSFDAPHLRYRLFIVGYTKYPRLIASEKPRGITQRGNGSTPRKNSASEFERSDFKLEIMAYANRQGLESGGKNKKRTHAPLERCDRWVSSPGVLRVDYGFPDRVDRIRGTANAVVPQVAEHIANMILKVEAGDDLR